MIPTFYPGYSTTHQSAMLRQRLPVPSQGLQILSRECRFDLHP
jgi:hypothetical protein